MDLALGGMGKSLTTSYKMLRWSRGLDEAAGRGAAVAPTKADHESSILRDGRRLPSTEGSGPGGRALRE